MSRRRVPAFDVDDHDAGGHHDADAGTGLELKPSIDRGRVRRRIAQAVRDEPTDGTLVERDR